MRSRVLWSVVPVVAGLVVVCTCASTVDAASLAGRWKVLAKDGRTGEWVKSGEVVLVPNVSAWDEDGGEFECESCYYVEGGRSIDVGRVDWNGFSFATGSKLLGIWRYPDGTMGIHRGVIKSRGRTIEITIEDGKGSSKVRWEKIE